MEEVMAKSKKYKAEKQHQREEDLNETEALDNQFKALIEGRLMAGLLKPKGEKGLTPKGKGDDPEGAAFDVMRRELVFDAKAKVGGCTYCQLLSAQVLQAQVLVTIAITSHWRTCGIGSLACSGLSCWPAVAVAFYLWTCW